MMFGYVSPVMSSDTDDPQPKANDPKEADSNSLRKRPKHLFNATLSGIEELDQFETEEKKQKALSEIGKEAANPLSFSFWLAVLILAAGTFAATRISKWALRFVHLNSIAEEIIQYVVTFIVFFLLLRWLHRWGARDDLRKKLLAQGIPVCLGCGYSLRGLCRAHERCPECGRVIDEKVRKLMPEKQV